MDERGWRPFVSWNPGSAPEVPLQAIRFRNCCNLVFQNEVITDVHKRRKHSGIMVSSGGSRISQTGGGQPQSGDANLLFGQISSELAWK